MPSGSVKWFNRTKGYGFITPDDGGGDVYVNISVLQASNLVDVIRDGDRVAFEVATKADGRRRATSTTLENKG